MSGHWRASAKRTFEPFRTRSCDPLQRSHERGCGQSASPAANRTGRTRWTKPFVLKCRSIARGVDSLSWKQATTFIIVETSREGRKDDTVRVRQIVALDAVGAQSRWRFSQRLLQPARLLCDGRQSRDDSAGHRSEDTSWRRLPQYKCADSHTLRANPWPSAPTKPASLEK